MSASADKQEAARMEERQRIARNVHDALGGDLAAIKMALAVLGRRLPADESLRAQLAYVDKLVDGAIDSMHGVVEKMHGMLTGRLDQVIARQLAEFSRQSGLECRQELAAMPLDASTPTGQALYYILRECLTNIGKHAQAACVRVALRQADDHVALEVEDDGVGLMDRGNGFGLGGMRRRAQELGGEFSVRAVAPHGTLAMVKLPVPA